jgi:arylsulfatase A-like enzyme
MSHAHIAAASLSTHGFAVAARLLRIVLSAILALVVTGCRPDAPDAQRKRFDTPHIVIITLDTTRADHLGCYGYFRNTSPYLDSFAKEGIVFDRCLAPMATTLPTHTSLLTGTYPIEHGVLANVYRGGRPYVPSPDLISWAELARRGGYETGGFVSAAPLKKFTGINAGFDTYEEPGPFQRSAAETNVGALAWLEARTGDRPCFLWVHYYDPHFPYTPIPEYDTFTTDEALEKFIADRKIHASAPNRSLQPVEARRAHNAYDGEIRYMDEQLRILMDKVDRVLGKDNTLVVIVGDHGEGLCQHGEASHGSTWDEQLHVPLLIRIPGEKPRRIATVMSLVDIAPTMLAWVKGEAFAPLLKQTSGRDVLAAGAGSAPVFSQRRGQAAAEGDKPAFAATTERWKYIHEVGGEDALYDLSVDPYELNNVLVKGKEPAPALLDFIMRTMATQTKSAARYQSKREGAPAKLDPVVLEQLRTLGYLGADEEEEEAPAPPPLPAPQPGDVDPDGC